MWHYCTFIARLCPFSHQSKVFGKTIIERVGKKSRNVQHSIFIDVAALVLSIPEHLAMVILWRAPGTGSTCSQVSGSDSQCITHSSGDL